jgi:hypothetical protein
MKEKPMRLARTTRFVGGLALLLAFGPAAWGQSLGEAARKEKERRQKAGPTGPAFTDDDLRGYAESGPAAKGAAGAPDKSTAGEKSSGDKATKEGAARGGGGAGDEAYWRSRAKAARAAVAAAEARVAQAEAAAQGASAGIRQPQPSDALTQVPPPVVTDADRRAAEAALAAVRGDLERAKKVLADLEEEARRKGALPGWLR